jgi:hypothetical protein
MAAVILVAVETSVAAVAATSVAVEIAVAAVVVVTSSYH